MFSIINNAFSTFRYVYWLHSKDVLEQEKLFHCVLRGHSLRPILFFVTYHYLLSSVYAEAFVNSASHVISLSWSTADSMSVYLEEYQWNFIFVQKGSHLLSVRLSSYMEARFLFSAGGCGIGTGGAELPGEVQHLVIFRKSVCQQLFF